MAAPAGSRSAKEAEAAAKHRAFCGEYALLTRYIPWLNRPYVIRLLCIKTLDDSVRGSYMSICQNLRVGEYIRMGHEALKPCKAMGDIEKRHPKLRAVQNPSLSC